MASDNLSTVHEFMIVGFADLPQWQVPLFAALLLIYLLTLMGNLLIMTTIYSNSNLHTPMYFFISNLSFLDITYTSMIFPLMLANFFLNGTHIYFTGCFLQMYFFTVMVSIEVILLTVMAFDRYAAICNPLRYMSIMNKAVCIWLAVGSWVLGLMDPIPHVVLISGLSFCKSHTINHFFCDVTALMRLSCSSTRPIEILTYTFGALLPLLSFILIIISYSNIVSSILKMKSKRGRWKAFSTCASHLTVVILFYGSVCSTYMRPASTMENNKILSLSYIAVAPLFNPIIYTLKNTEFKRALRKAKKPA